MTSSGQETTPTNATEQVTTRSDTTQELTTTSTQDLTSSSRIRNFNNPTLDYNTIQETITNNITQTIHQMMEALTNNLKGLIQEEIKNTRKEETKQQQKLTHTNPKADQNTGSEIHLPSTSEVVQEEQQEQHANEEPWRQVTRRRGRRPARQQPAMTGVGPSDDDLQAVDKMAWFFVGRLKLQTTTGTIKNFLAKKGIKENVICEELSTKGSTKLLS
ncbi:hypothetical protein L9F63_014650 [Diploptera punctata]|uniref:Uncharacterized protein n=1 Tax=Diploptera punctata TaxID=6984 RepID=A0AAD8EKW7_DIPPU|nr:hypothetical protein L9F63_014650 [Diploptera punctata]